MESKFDNTLGNDQWLRDHEADLKKLFPADWIRAEAWGQVAAMRAAFNFKLLGLDWRTKTEFGLIMVYMEKIGIIQRIYDPNAGNMFRANPESIFSQSLGLRP